MFFIKDGKGDTHIQYDHSNYRTLCGFAGENDEYEEWQTVHGVEPTCPYCRMIIAFVASLPFPKKKALAMDKLRDDQCRICGRDAPEGFVCAFCGKWVCEDHAKFGALKTACCSQDCADEYDLEYGDHLPAQGGKEG